MENDSHVHNYIHTPTTATSSTSSTSISTHDYTKTHINGLPATYVLTKNPDDPAGDSFVVAKVLDVPSIATMTTTSENSPPTRIPHSYKLYNYSDTPLHLCDTNSIITQYRCSNHNLQHRTIDISKGAYSNEEISWYSDPESKIPEPTRLVIIPMLRCFLCGDFQNNEDDIHYESSGQHAYGYRYCTECRPYFMNSLYKAITPIITIRRDFEAWLASTDNTIHDRPFIWVARTRRDNNGKRIVLGNTPYIYTKWHILNWVTIKHKFPRTSIEDSTTIIEKEEYSLLCEQIEVVDVDGNIISKLVPIRDIYITNLPLLADPAVLDYDPNIDDPLNKYSESQQNDMFKAAFVPVDKQ